MLHVRSEELNGYIMLKPCYQNGTSDIMDFIHDGMRSRDSSAVQTHISFIIYIPDIPQSPAVLKRFSSCSC